MTQPAPQEVVADSSMAQLLRAMFESSQDAIVAKTLDGKVDPGV